jgi:hypothetical protein
VTDGEGGRGQPSSVAVSVGGPEQPRRASIPTGTETNHWPNLHGNHRFLHSGKNIVSSLLGAREDVVSPLGNDFLSFLSLSSFIDLPHQHF